MKEYSSNVDINVGDKIKVTEGPFKNFTGLVDSVQKDQNKLKAYLSVFGRDTLVELDFKDIEII